MVSRFLRLAVAALSLLATNCAIRPTPQQVTGVQTKDIVRQVRCETQDAVIYRALKWLIDEAGYDPEARRIGREFADGVRPINTLHPSLFSGRVNEIGSLFFGTGIAYTFELEMREDNNLEAGMLDFLRPFIRGKYTLGLRGEFSRYRQNTRIFTITDTFGGLIQDLDDRYCSKTVDYANYIYPVVGKIGMYEMIDQFVDMTMFGGLAGRAEDKGEGPPTMSDTLEFYTFLSGSANPAFMFAPVTGAWHRSLGSITGKLSRRDKHKVTVGLAVDKGDVHRVEPLRQQTFVGSLVTGRERTPSEAAAVNAVNQALTLQIFRNNVIIAP